MSYIFSFLIAILLTALSYFFGSRLITNGIAIWQAVLIGACVVSLGAASEALGAPIWLIVLIPFPVGMILLYLFLKKQLHIWFLTYLTTLILYIVIHIIASYFFHYHSLVPACKLS